MTDHANTGTPSWAAYSADILGSFDSVCARASNRYNIINYQFITPVFS